MISITIDFTGAEGLLHRMSDLTPVMPRIGEILTSSIQRNFDEGGRPERWRPSRRVIRYGGKTLIQSGSLKNSIRGYLSRNSVTLSSALPYSRIHQLGGRAGRGHKANISARPFMVVQQEDITAIDAVIQEFLTR